MSPLTGDRRVELDKYRAEQTEMRSIPISEEEAEALRRHAARLTDYPLAVLLYGLYARWKVAK